MTIYRSQLIFGNYGGWNDHFFSGGFPASRISLGGFSANAQYAVHILLGGQIRRLGVYLATVFFDCCTEFSGDISATFGRIWKTISPLNTAKFSLRGIRQTKRISGTQNYFRVWGPPSGVADIRWVETPKSHSSGTYAFHRYDWFLGKLFLYAVRWIPEIRRLSSLAPPTLETSAIFHESWVRCPHKSRDIMKAKTVHHLKMCNHLPAKPAISDVCYYILFTL